MKRMSGVVQMEDNLSYMTQHACCRQIQSASRSWKSAQPKRAGGQKDRMSLLDEIIARINEEFFGDFTNAEKCCIIQKARVERLYKELHGSEN